MELALKPPGFLSRLLRFTLAAYAPGLHLGYASLVVLGFEALSLLALDPGGTRPWRWTPATAAAIVTVFLLLFVIRVVDEIKDYDYDKALNPDRPLVTGAVSRRDLHLFNALAAALALGLNAGASLWVLGLVGADLAYAYLLLGLERLSPRVRDGLFLNMAVTFPVNLAIEVYVFLALLEKAVPAFAGASGGSRAADLVVGLVLFASAFLHYEFCRKTAWPGQAQPGKRLYSDPLGTGRALAIIWGLALLSSVGAVLLARPWERPGASGLTGWLFLGLLALPAQGTRKLLALRGSSARPRKAEAMAPLGMVYLAAYLIAVVLHAAVDRGLVLTWMQP